MQVARIFFEVRAARDRELTQLRKRVIVHPQCCEMKGHGHLKKRCVVKGHGSQEPDEDETECKAPDFETLAGQLRLQGSNVKTANWIGMMGDSKKELREVKKEQKEDKDVDRKMIKKAAAEGNRYRDFEIKDVKFQKQTGEF